MPVGSGLLGNTQHVAAGTPTGREVRGEPIAESHALTLTSREVKEACELRKPVNLACELRIGQTRDRRKAGRPPGHIREGSPPGACRRSQASSC